jgi:hypothetical protein
VSSIKKRDEIHSLQLRKLNAVISDMKDSLQKEQLALSTLQISFQKLSVNSANEKRKLSDAVAQAEGKTRVTAAERDKVAKVARQEAEVAAHAHRTLTKELSAANDKMKTLQTQLDKLHASLKTKDAEHRAELADMEKKMKQDRKEVLQEATNIITKNLVRMCVVAPMVTINWGDRSMRFKTSMPQTKIRRIVDKEVLPNFTIIFRQDKEGMPPIGSDGKPVGSSLDTWLVKMGDQMQKALEKELLHVFQEASAGESN